MHHLFRVGIPKKKLIIQHLRDSNAFPLRASTSNNRISTDQHVINLKTSFRYWFWSQPLGGATGAVRIERPDSSRAPHARVYCKGDL